MRQLLTILILAEGLLMTTSTPSGADAADTVISRVGSERATSGAGNKIVTYEGKTHVVWQDVTPEGYFNRVRTLDHKTGRWAETVTLNKARDNHARPVIAVDHRGYLHAAMSGHNSPVTYRRSVRPNDASEWTKSQTIVTFTHHTPFLDRRSLKSNPYLIIRLPTLNACPVFGVQLSLTEKVIAFDPSRGRLGHTAGPHPSIVNVSTAGRQAEVWGSR